MHRRTALVAVAGLPVVLAAATTSARKAPAVETLERLLSIERRLESIYEAAIGHGTLTGGLAERLRDHEREHARALEQVLAEGDRRAPVASVPLPGLGTAIGRGASEFARFALALESEAVAAYQDTLVTLDEPGLLQPLGSILACEGQHLVALRRVAGLDLLPSAFETGT